MSRWVSVSKHVWQGLYTHGYQSCIVKNPFDGSRILLVYERVLDEFNNPVEELIEDGVYDRWCPIWLLKVYADKVVSNELKAKYNE